MSFDKNFLQGLPPAKKEPNAAQREVAQGLAGQMQAFRDAGMSKHEAYDLAKSILLEMVRKEQG